MADYGFDGVFTEAEYSQMWALGGVDAVRDVNAWKVVSGSGRQVTVDRTGWAFAAGVLSKGDTTATVNLATPAAGQWHLLVRRIDWSNNTVTVVSIAHTTTTTTTPTAAPTTYPTVNSTPGTLYDHLLGWAWVNSANTLTTVFDLRGLPLTDQLTGKVILSRIPNLPASVITSGSIDLARIPSLPASQTTSGTFDVARIPTLGDANISALAATKLTGTISDARLSTNVPIPRGDLPTDGDWNTYTAAGTYKTFAGANGANSPVGAGAGNLVVSVAVNTLTQTWFAQAGGIAKRVFYVTWSAWEYFEPTTDTGWSMAPISVSSGWDTPIDPEGQYPSTIGGVRKRNALVEVRFRISRNGATIASSGGNVTDSNIASLPVGYRPASMVFGSVSSGPGVAIGQASLDNAGNIILTSLTDGSVLNDGVLQISFMYFVG